MLQEIVEALTTVIDALGAAIGTAERMQTGLQDVNAILDGYRFAVRLNIALAAVIGVLGAILIRITIKNRRQKNGG